MKKLLLLSILLLAPALYVNGGRAGDECGDTMVWICMSENAYAYHCDRDCRGLNRCGCQIKRVTLSEAKSQGKKKACGICY